MLDSPQSHENIPKFKLVRLSIDTRIYYKNLSKLEGPYSQENIIKG